MTRRVPAALARSLAALALVAPALLALAAEPARADELRSDEGVAIPLPEGWQRRTTKLGATTALAMERAEGNASPDAPRPTLVVNVLPTSAITEDKAFQQTRELLDRPAQVVDRPSGRFLRIDFDYDSNGHKLRSRLYAALRDKRLYYFILTSTDAAFARDAAAIDQVVDGATFFVPAPKAPAVPPEPPPAAPATPAPVSTVSPSGPGRPDPAVPAADRVAVPPAPAEPRRPAEPAPATGPTPPAPVTSPVAPSHPQGVRQAARESLLAPGTLISLDSEYDPDLRAAANLVDGSATKGWCSAPSARPPHRFTFALARLADVARVSFDDACPDEPGFENASAREVLVEGSSEGPNGPWRELGRKELAPGRNEQDLDLPGNEARWLRIAILSNAGHPTLTRLMEVRAHAAEWVAPVPRAPSAPVVSTDEGPFRLERTKLSHERSGPALDPAVVAPGETVWVYFKPKALRLDARGEYGLQVDLRLEDARGQEKLASPRIVDHHAKPPRPPLSPFVSLKLELPPSFDEGAYVVILVARDTEAGTEVRERIPFDVKKAR